jgi:hypothetical protein
MRIGDSHSSAIQMSNPAKCYLTERIVNFLSLTGRITLFEVLFIDCGFVNFTGNLNCERSDIYEILFCVATVYVSIGTVPQL